MRCTFAGVANFCARSSVQNATKHIARSPIILVNGVEFISHVFRVALGGGEICGTCSQERIQNELTRHTL